MSTPGPDCLGELELDRLLAGEPAPALRARLAACEHCQARLAALTVAQRAHLTPGHVAAQTDAILARLAAEPAVAPPPPPPLWRRWIAAPAVVLAAAAALLLWTRRDDAVGDERPDHGDIRVKGAPALEVVLASPGSPRTLDDGEPVPVGAALSFRASCPRGCSAALFDVSADGIAPLVDATPAPWPITAPALLPVSAVVDAGPGDDVIVALLCEQPRAAEALRAALDAIGAAALQAAPPPTVAGCALRHHRIRRAP